MDSRDRNNKERHARDQGWAWKMRLRRRVGNTHQRQIRPGRYCKFLATFVTYFLLTFFMADQSSSRTSGPLRTDIHIIIIHAVGGPQCVDGRVTYSETYGDAVKWKNYFDNHPFLGIHYIVDREGMTLGSTPEQIEANHALANNRGTIGIELVHAGDGIEPFSDRQINALIDLIKSIRTRHAIPIENIKSHDEVDARTFLCGGQSIKTKQDPGKNFPWPRLHDALRKESK